MELYEFICKRFDSQISQFNSFKEDLEYFQKFNRTYGDIHIKYFYNSYNRVYNKFKELFRSR